ncbi:MAG: hypothetical protein MRY79_05085 [Alphaproteobacteria bacterium]|nr:hypothetical protein [Alphaproteobacteria bacterium]
MGAFSNTVVSGFEQKPFDIIEAFSDLDSTRKMALFDRLNGSSQTFYNTATLFWPTASNSDCKRLEKFMARYVATRGTREEV